LKKFLIINPYGIGDVLFTTPLIRALKGADPENKIGYWCNERVRSLFENHPDIDNVYALSRGDIKKIYRRSFLAGSRCLLSLLRAIRKQRYDVALDFSLDYRYSFIAKLLGIPKRAGFDYKGRGRFLTDKIDINGYDAKHVSEYYLDILKIFSIPVPARPRLQVFSPPKAIEEAENFLRRHQIKKTDLLVAVAPAGGASWEGNGQYLRWPEDKFAALCDILIKEHNAKIILFGSPGETDICAKVESLCKGKVTNTSGALSLEQFVALMSQARIAVCNDAGPLHVAVASGVKAVCICGPVDEKVYGPYPLQMHAVVTRKGLSCRPCYKNFSFKGCLNDLSCLKEISVEDVLAAARRML
jgi:heptosyltransferase II